MAYQFSLGLSLTPQRDDGHVRVKERNYAPIGQFPINQKYLSVSRLGQIEKVQCGGLRVLLPKNLAMNSLCDFGRKIPQRFSSFCFRDRSLYNYRPRDQSWLVRLSWARGNMSCATPSLTT